MTYKIVFTKNALKDIKKLDRITKKILRKKLDIYLKSPHKYLRKLVDKRVGKYRWRIGNYRIVFDIVDRNIVILRVRHRREVYK